MQHFKFPFGIFKAYDIRGVVGQDWNAHWALEIGRGMGSLLRERHLSCCVIARDGRLSGPELMAALIEGVRSTGIHVLDIGLAATPVGYFAEYHLNADAVLIVTASHNAAPYNGIKLVVENCALAGEDIQVFMRRIQMQQFVTSELQGRHDIVDIRMAYRDRIVNTVKVHRPMRVAVDCGNGIMALHAVEVLTALGVEVVPLYCTLDGSFPNHEPDPSKEENVRDLKQIVSNSQCELGLAFDGDGDRLVVLTKEGEMVDTDRLLMFFADAVLKTVPIGGRVVYDVKSTRALVPWIKERGGVPILARTGHSFMKAAMRENKACLGGEMSGHFFFADRWYGFDDGLYAAARLLEYLSVLPDSSAVLHALPKFFNTSEIHWHFASDAMVHATMAHIIKEACFAQAACIYRIDGLRVEYSNGFGLIRASNTSPLIVLRFEGDTEAALAAIQSDFRAEIERVCGSTMVLPMFN